MGRLIMHLLCSTFYNNPIKTVCDTILYFFRIVLLIHNKIIFRIFDLSFNQYFYFKYFYFKYYISSYRNKKFWAQFNFWKSPELNKFHFLVNFAINVKIDYQISNKRSVAPTIIKLFCLEYRVWTVAIITNEHGLGPSQTNSCAIKDFCWSGFTYTYMYL